MKRELESILHLRDTSFPIPISDAHRLDHGPLHLRLFRELWHIYPRVSPKIKQRDVLSRLKFTVRGAFHGAPMEAWLNFLRQPEMRDIASQQPLLYLRLQWPYIDRNLTATQRLQLLQNHYNFILQRFSPAFRSAAFCNHGLTLAKWNVPSLGNFALNLQHHHDFGHEGEIVLSLDHENPSRKCAFLHFSIPLAPGSQPEIFIGCLQGGKPDAEYTSQKLTARFTQLMHGSRPKNLLIFALRRLARYWSINRIRAVSTQLHVFRPHLKTDYDVFWRELGGTCQADGLFDIPLAGSSLDDISQVKPKRRPVYRRRCALWDSIGEQIDGTLEKLN